MKCFFKKHFGSKTFYQKLFYSTSKVIIKMQVLIERSTRLIHLSLWRLIDIYVGFSIIFFETKKTLMGIQRDITWSQQYAIYLPARIEILSGYQIPNPTDWTIPTVQFKSRNFIIIFLLTHHTHTICLERRSISLLNG